LVKYTHKSQKLVDEHAGEDADEDPDDRKSEESSKARIEDAVDHVAVGGSGKHEPKSRWKFK